MLTPQLLPLGPMSLNMLCLTLCSYLAVQALYMPDAVEFHFLHSVSKVGSLCHTPWSLKTYTHEPQLPPRPPPQPILPCFPSHPPSLTPSPSPSPFPHTPVLLLALGSNPLAACVGPQLLRRLRPALCGRCK